MILCFSSGHSRSDHGNSLKLKNPAVPLNQRDGESPKFKENSLHFKVRSLIPLQRDRKQRGMRSL